MEQPQNFFKSLQIIHKALLLGMVIFIGIGIVLTTSSDFQLDAVDIDRTLQIVAVVLAAGLPALGFSLFKKRVASLQPSASVKDRAVSYKTASVVRWALIEMPAIFAVICFLLTDNYAYMALATALVFVFAATNPSRTKVIFQLRLSDKEAAELAPASK